MPAPWRKHWPAGPADKLGWHAACPPAPHPPDAPLLPDFQRQLHAMRCSTCCCHLQTSSHVCCEKLLVLKITAYERSNAKIASLKAALERPKHQLQHRSHELWHKVKQLGHCVPHFRQTRVAAHAVLRSSRSSRHALLRHCIIGMT